MFYKSKKKSIEKITSGLRNKNLRLEVYNKLNSTNDTAKGSPAGTVVIAKKQTKGKGSKGRTFFSPKGGIYLSVSLEPHYGSNGNLTVCAAVAGRRAIKQATGIDVSIKWVNDLMKDGKKICGILAESHIEDGEIKRVVIGAGFNHYIKKFPKNLSAAASIRDCKPKKGERERIIVFFLNELDALLSDGNAIDEYVKNCGAVGKKIEIEGRDGQFCVVSVGSDGALIIETEKGRESVRAGVCFLTDAPQ